MLTSPPKIRDGSWKEGCRQLLDLAIKFTGANHGAFLTLDRGDGSLCHLENQRLPWEYWEAARQAARKSVPLLFHGKEGTSASPILAVPVQRGGSLLGVLVIADHPRRPFTGDDLHLVRLLAESPSLTANWTPPQRDAIQQLDSIRALLQTLEARDHYTCQHSFRVTEIALDFGRTLGLPEEDLAVIKTAGPLHDLGKVGISDAILLKSGTLNEEECAIMKTHPVIGVNIVKPLGLKPRELEIILHHHERWDGRGYPHGLAQKEIPFLCRLVALADIFDALTSDRPYRRLFPVAVALEEIGVHAGTQFDPELTHEFLKMLTSQAQ